MASLVTLFRIDGRLVLTVTGFEPVILETPVVVAGYDLDGLSLLDIDVCPHAALYVGPEPRTLEEAKRAHADIEAYLSGMDLLDTATEPVDEAGKGGGDE